MLCEAAEDCFEEATQTMAVARDKFRMFCPHHAKNLSDDGQAITMSWYETILNKPGWRFWLGKSWVDAV